jgi:magnesium chelatase family protein
VPARAFSASTLGVDGYLVRVEADSSAGTPAFSIIGLPDRALSESRERIRAAIFNSGFAYPAGRLLVNLAPADIRKEGPGFDLPIALALLAIDDQIDQDRLSQIAAIGELALDGSLCPVHGILPMTLGLKAAGFTQILVPRENAEEAALVEGVDVFTAGHLAEAVSVMLGHGKSFQRLPEDRAPAMPPSEDFADVRGQAVAKRALEIAAAGGHHLLLVGPPGCGKSMLARRLPSILPRMSNPEALAVTSVHSASGLIGNVRGLVRARPFRAPHHTITPQGLIGGGRTPRPGEASLAHHGVLFLDELPEYTRGTLETLRQPLEEGQITIGRSMGSLTYPARFMLIVAMNPCPCGLRGERQSDCRCDEAAVVRYFSKLSGPLLDRIDLRIEVARVEMHEIATTAPAESSSLIRSRVEAARASQRQRYQEASYTLNAHAPARLLREATCMDAKALELALRITERARLSARAFDRLLRVARTIADLAVHERTEPMHVAEAFAYRQQSMQKNGYNPVL